MRSGGTAVSRGSRRGSRLCGCSSGTVSRSVTRPDFFGATRSAAPLAFTTAGYPLPGFDYIPLLPVEVAADVLLLPVDAYNAVTGDHEPATDE